MFTLSCCVLNGQISLTYPLTSNLEESQGEHQDLKPLFNGDDESGYFDAFTVPTTTCPSNFDVNGYHFYDNAGLRFENDGFITCEYTVKFTFHIKEFSGPQGWVRVLSFDPDDDTGIYIKLTNQPTSGSLEFYPNGIVGDVDFFNGIDLYQLVITRTCAGLVDIYVNGEYFASYDDSSSPIYLVQPSYDVIDFFQDDTQVANEASPGWVKNIVISDFASDLAFVEEEWDEFCEVLQETDCNGVMGGTAVTDECGVCLELNDPDFNQSCVDCAGVPNGTAIIDDCGDCNTPDGPDFNQSCADCAGTPNGTAVIDECGVCLLPNDPNFNKSCDDCAGVMNGQSVIDECGICLLPNDPDFNQSCADCAGTPNGSAVIDECGECLLPSDPDFNQSCADCAGTPNGLAVIDECGVCLLPDDVNFNQSCLDCNGVINGTSVVDECGYCLEPGDPNFNKSCSTEFFFPSVFSPNQDGQNDYFEVFKSSDTPASIKVYKIFNLWGELIHESKNFEFGDTDRFWDGSWDGISLNSGVYVYYVEILFENETVKSYSGDVFIAN